MDNLLTVAFEAHNAEKNHHRRYQMMRAIIRDRLRRRLSAPKRIGCPYRLAGFSAAPEFDAAAWLPGEVMAGFFKGDK